MTHRSTQPASWLSRLTRRRQTAAPSSLMHSRTEVRPPELWPSSIDWSGRLSRWLAGSASLLPGLVRPAKRLNQVRDEFLDSLQDLPGAQSQPLAQRIGKARSLRELWHLRSELYGALAVTLNQTEAERRLALLNRHFPQRTARVSLAPELR